VDIAGVRSTWLVSRVLIGVSMGMLVLMAVDVAWSDDDAPATAVASADEALPPPTVAQAGPVPSSTVAVDLPPSFTLAVTGELLPHPSVVEHAARFGAQRGLPYDFAGLFRDVSPVIAVADLAICHLEVPVAPPGREPSGYPSFAIPSEIAAGIRDTGWDRCSTASNHSNDQGTTGIVATLDALDAAGVGHSGMARTVEEAAVAPIHDAGGVPVAHLSYTWGFNATPPREPWMVDVINPAVVLADAAGARAAGAAVVVVSLHWGNEYDTAGTNDQRALAEQLLASPDVDLVVGHGPHVLQPIVQHGDEYALLSVGNLVANQGTSKPHTYDGVVATLTFERRDDGSYRAAPPVVEPTWYDRDAGRVRLVHQAIADDGLAGIRDALVASADRTATIMGPYVADR